MKMQNRKGEKSVSNEMEDKYFAYKLRKQYDPKKQYLKGMNRHLVKETPGLCTLELLFETGSVNEITELKPMKTLYYKCGDNNVKVFDIDEYSFYGLDIKCNSGNVCYHIDGHSPIYGKMAFEYIYRACDADIVFISKEWNALNIESMRIYLENRKMQKYWQQYDLKFD